MREGEREPGWTVQTVHPFVSLQLFRNICRWEETRGEDLLRMWVGKRWEEKEGRRCYRCEFLNRHRDFVIRGTLACLPSFLPSSRRAWGIHGASAGMAGNAKGIGTCLKDQCVADHPSSGMRRGGEAKAGALSEEDAISCCEHFQPFCLL